MTAVCECFFYCAGALGLLAFLCSFLPIELLFKKPERKQETYFKPPKEETPEWSEWHTRYVCVACNKVLQRRQGCCQDCGDISCVRSVRTKGNEVEMRGFQC